MLRFQCNSACSGAQSEERDVTFRVRDFRPRDAYPAILRVWDKDDNPADYEVYRQDL